MADRWYYTHGGAAHGPVTAAALCGLVDAEGVASDDPIWPEGLDAGDAVRACTLLPFPPPPPGAPERFGPRPAPAPEWVPGLPDVAGGEPAAPPPALAWLEDVRRVEESARPREDGSAGRGDG